MKKLLALVLSLVMIFSLVGCSDKKDEKEDKDSPATAVKNYVDVMLKGNAKKLKSLAPAEFWEYLEDEEDLTLDDCTERFEEGYEMTQEYLKEEFGDDYKISHKVNGKEELSEKKLAKIADGLNENYGISTKKVTKAYEMEVEVSIKGSDDDDEVELTLIVAKIGSKWYPVTESGILFYGF